MNMLFRIFGSIGWKIQKYCKLKINFLKVLSTLLIMFYAFSMVNQIYKNLKFLLCIFP